MATKELVKIFSPESYAGGGSFFNNGVYRIDEARFVRFDFNGTVPDGLASLCCKLQPLDKDSKDAGEAVVQYWGLGADIEIENKGHAISMSGDYSTIWSLSDCGIFMDHLGKAGFDRDAYAESNDIADLDNLVVEFARIPNPRTGKPGAKDDNKEGKAAKPPREVVVPVRVLKGGATAAKGSSKPAPPAKKEETTASSPSGGDDAVRDLLLRYLAEKVCTDKNKGGIEKIQGRINIATYVKANGGDSDMVKAVSAMFNKEESLKGLLDDLGWKLDGSTIKE